MSIQNVPVHDHPTEQCRPVRGGSIFVAVRQDSSIRTVRGCMCACVRARARAHACVGVQVRILEVVDIVEHKCRYVEKGGYIETVEPAGPVSKNKVHTRPEIECVSCKKTDVLSWKGGPESEIKFGKRSCRKLVVWRGMCGVKFDSVPLDACDQHGHIDDAKMLCHLESTRAFSMMRADDAG